MMWRNNFFPAKSVLRAFFVLLVVLVLLLGAGYKTDEAHAAEKTGTVVIESLHVRAGAGTLNQSLGFVYMGEKLTILGTEKDYTGTVWYQISFNGGIGYVSSDYVSLDSNNEYVYDSAFEASMTAEGFPESYKTYLRKIHADYPAWVFQAAHTGIDWSAAVSAESKPGVTLVTGSAASSWKSTDPGAYNPETGTYISYDSGNWVTASRAIIEYYMDPRNFLNSGGIFQFLAHSYDSRTQTAQGLQGVLDGTFMGGIFPEEGYSTYNEVLMEVGAKTGVNPYVLASMILVEQGNSGIGKSISGTVSGYEGYYNHFNVGAYASGGMDAVTRGLWYASQSGSYSRPWDSIYKSIYGGASFYGENYVKMNKHTLYLKKFNVMNGLSSVGTGQYMTNVQGAESEAAALRKGYLSVMDSAMTFIVPIYENMPSQACLKPISSASNDNYLASLKVDGCTLSPAFDRTVTSYTAVVPAGVKSVNIQAAANDANAKVRGTGTVVITSEQKTVNIVVTSASGIAKTYTVTLKSSSEDPSGALKTEIEATAIKLSSALDGSTINLSWTKNSDCELDYYEVFRSTKKSSGYGTKAYFATENGSQTKYSDSGNFQGGTTYYYKVRGVRLVDGVKVYTQWSTKAWRTVPKDAASSGNVDEPELPLSSTARGVMATTIDVESELTENGKVQLTWKKSPGYKVDYYQIFRAESKDGAVPTDTAYGDIPFFTTKNGDALSYLNSKNLSAGVTYYYKVRGVRNVDGVDYYTTWSDATSQKMAGELPDNADDPDASGSDESSEELKNGIMQTTISMSSSLQKNGSIRINWTKSEGYDVDYYEVFRSVERYKGYGTSPFYATGSGTKTYYVNTKSLVSGKTYYYKVRGVKVIDGEKVYTQWSNKSWRTVK